MLPTPPALLLSVLILTGCATTVPVAVTCPLPAPLPAALTESVSTEPSLSLRYSNSMGMFRESLAKAMLPD